MYTSNHSLWHLLVQDGRVKWWYTKRSNRAWEKSLKTADEAFRMWTLNGEKICVGNMSVRSHSTGSSGLLVLQMLLLAEYLYFISSMNKEFKAFICDPVFRLLFLLIDSISHHWSTVPVIILIFTNFINVNNLQYTGKIIIQTTMSADVLSKTEM